MAAVLRAEQVAFHYPQDGRGLAPVSLRLEPGEALHVSSLSGGGKSTLARCLAGLIPHLYHGQLEGAVWAAGLRTSETPLWRLSEAAGLVFQNPAAQMLAPTVEEELIFGLENLGLPGDEIDRRVRQALAGLGLAALGGRSPLTLSGGEQQKLALAAVMARRPPLLVLDEPLSMLDTTAALDLAGQLADLAAQGTALVICEHRAEYLQALPGLRTLALASPPPPAAPAGLAWPAPPAPALLLRAAGLRVLRGGRAVLDGWDFSLQGGQLTAIVGRNGVGKTTLLRTLAGLQPYQGCLEVAAGGRALRPQLGLVFQNPDLQLFNATVRDEILYGLEHPDPELYAWLAAALDLQRCAQAPPLLLSEGEKRRLALAAILMRRPAHGVLLDEPALGQDAAHKALLVSVLRALAAAGQLVAYATHDVELALQADRLVLLGPQGILASAPPGELRQQAGPWRQAGLRLPAWLGAPC